MFIRKKKRNLGGIPTASLSDVAFLLLVFFLTTTKFDIKKGIGLTLPVKAKDPGETARVNPENVTKIQIAKDGKIQIKVGKNEPQEVALSEIKGMIGEVVSGNPDMVISLKTHRLSDYKNMVDVLDRLRLAGAEKISLGTN